MHQDAFREEHPKCASRSCARNIDMLTFRPAGHTAGTARIGPRDIRTASSGPKASGPRPGSFFSPRPKPEKPLSDCQLLDSLTLNSELNAWSMSDTAKQPRLHRLTARRVSHGLLGVLECAWLLRSSWHVLDNDKAHMTKSAC